MTTTPIGLSPISYHIAANVGAIGGSGSTTAGFMTVTAGDVIILGVHANCTSSTLPTTTVSSTAGVTWTQIGTKVDTVTKQLLHIWQGVCDTLTGSMSLTVTFSAAVNEWTTTGYCFTGLDTKSPLIDGPTFASNYSGSAATATITGTVSRPNQSVGFALYSSIVAATGPATPSGWTDNTSGGIGKNNQSWAFGVYKNATGSTQTANFGSATNWALAIMTLAPKPTIQLLASTVTGLNTSGVASILCPAQPIGTLMLAHVQMNNNTSGIPRNVTVSDNLGNTWAKLAQSQSSVAGAVVDNEVWWAITASGSAPTVATTASGSVDGGVLLVSQWSGVDQANPFLDNSGAFAQTNYTASNVQPSYGQTVSRPGAVTVASAFSFTTRFLFGTQPANFNYLNGATSGSVTASLTVAYRQEQASGTDTVTWQQTSAEWAAHSVTLNPAWGVTSVSSAAVATGATPTATFQNTAPCLMIARVAHYGVGSYVTTSSVTDSAGNVWTRRSQTQEVSAYAISGIEHLTHEVWWAWVPAINTSNVTVTFNVANSAAQGLAPHVALYAVGGVWNPQAPWDSTGYSKQLYSHASTPQTPTGVQNTATKGSLALASLMQMTASGTAIDTTSSGWTAISNLSVGSTTHEGEADLSKVVFTPSASTPNTWNAAQLAYIQVNDALSGDSTGTSADPTSGVTGTITTSLTKVSQAISGVEYPRGTITTNLTKASQTAAAKETFTGTITTNLTKASISAFAAKLIFTGTIATRLTKASQSVSGTDTPLAVTGTVTTALTKISQSLGRQTITGTMTTPLTKASISAAGKEIFTGTAVTNIDSSDHIAQGVVANETFHGTIQTNLRAGAHSLTGIVTVTGTVTMRLGGESGSLVANVVQAEEIIVGDIRTPLSPPRPLALGAKLGAPGTGKTYSWRA